MCLELAAGRKRRHLQVDSLGCAIFLVVLSEPALLLSLLFVLGVDNLDSNGCSARLSSGSALGFLRAVAMVAESCYWVRLDGSPAGTAMRRFPGSRAYAEDRYQRLMVGAEGQARGSRDDVCVEVPGMRQLARS